MYVDVVVTVVCMPPYVHNLMSSSLCALSVEKDGSPLSDEKQTVQISLFSLLRDFLLKCPTAEELHSILAYTLAIGEEQQVRTLTETCLLLVFIQRGFGSNHVLS
jgi:hypothetical protein